MTKLEKKTKMRNFLDNFINVTGSNVIHLHKALDGYVIQSSEEMRAVALCCEDSENLIFGFDESKFREYSKILSEYGFKVVVA